MDALLIEHQIWMLRGALPGSDGAKLRDELQLLIKASTKKGCPEMKAVRAMAIVTLIAFAAPAYAEMGPPPPPGWALEAPAAPSQAWGWQEGLIIGASLADLASTEYALRIPGLEEGNPLLSSRGVRFAVKAAATGAVLWLYRSLEKHGRHGWARFLLVWSAALWAGAAAWNVSLTR